ncbi:2-oxoglutarate-dependent dioxygenase [Trinickia terrae]|uniref:2-oxoglutarate-dependent dioxygenase n=1 Tax=Trinickia terrae TaxID=2571161 RepID=A0A4U1HRR2_9BURK|nr:2OG-Fe(II) oxygenase [Trinickia terrae]TKC81486.1 2-oxoglutarate-dependent dioxygenase [Trinickia terrae]
MLIVDAAWTEWLNTNAGLGCTPESMVDAMVKSGFDVDYAGVQVKMAINRHKGRTDAPAEAEAAAGQISAEYVYDAIPVASGNVIRAYDRDVQVLMRVEQPQVIVFGNVLSPEECSELIERSRSKLKRSGTVNPETGGTDIIPARTSEGTWFKRCEDAFIERIDKRIASLMNWPLENGEGLQILHYKVGGEYRAHYDYFDPNTKGSAVHIQRGGQRVATLVVYLNDVPDGGETTFPEAGITVGGRQGNAVYFRYMNDQRQLDPLSLHGGAPVREGEKWVMTKWVREHRRDV